MWRWPFALAVWLGVACGARTRLSDADVGTDASAPQMDASVPDADAGALKCEGWEAEKMLPEGDYSVSLAVERDGSEHLFWRTEVGFSHRTIRLGASIDEAVEGLDWWWGSVLGSLVASDGSLQVIARGRPVSSDESTILWARRDDAGWSFEPTGIAPGDTAAASLAADERSQPQLAMVAVTADASTLVVASRSLEGWERELVPDPGCVPERTTLATGPESTLHLACFGSDLTLRWGTNRGGEWVFREVMDDVWDRTDARPALLVTGDGVVRLAYQTERGIGLATVATDDRIVVDERTSPPANDYPLALGFEAPEVLHATGLVGEFDEGELPLFWHGRAVGEGEWSVSCVLPISQVFGGFRERILFSDDCSGATRVHVLFFAGGDPITAPWVARSLCP